MRYTRRSLVGALTLVLVLSACGTDGEEPPGTPAPSEPVATPTASEPPPDDDGAGNGDAGAGELPGEVFDLFPYEGAELAVVGVDVQDVLNVRAAPGVDHDVVVELGPLADGLVATGHNRQLDDGGIWAEVEVDEETGWVNVAYLSHLGQVHDVTSELAELPSGQDVVELATQVTAQRTPSEGPDLSVTVVDGPNDNDLVDVTVDILGMPDDSVQGERLRVYAQRDGEMLTVRTVELTVLCARGAAEDGLCL